MKQFLDETFLLESPLAETLYNEYAKGLPIIDYHCHLEAKEIFENQQYENIVDLSLSEDHYKWKLMRASGIDEHYITGGAEPYDKFLAFTDVLTHSIGNVMYHWTHLEYKRFFGANFIAKKENAAEQYRILNDYLEKHEVTPQKILTQCNVIIVGTTDDPLDALIYHKKLAEQESKTKVIPTFRADPLFSTNPNINDYIQKLATVVGAKVNTLEDYEKAIISRLDYFLDHDCRSIDIGISVLPQQYNQKEVAMADFVKRAFPSDALDGYMLEFLMEQSKLRNLVVQLHIGPLRNINENKANIVGINSGFDMMNNQINIQSLICLFNVLEQKDRLPKTIIYNLNAMDNHILDCFIGAFQGTIKSKIQHGTPWWFNDNLDGFLAHFNSYKQATSFYNFLGMTTDSRSFLSMSRHEYYRRIVCNFIAEEVNCGHFPHDEVTLKEIVEAVCFGNAHNYFEKGKRANMTNQLK